MNGLVQRFYQQLNEDPNFETSFYAVLFIEENSQMDFEKYAELSPELPRGWYELSQLNQKDRIEFTKEFWMKMLTFQPRVNHFLEEFFSRLDDIGIYLTKEQPESDFEPELVYSLADGSSFFRGFPPATGELMQEVRVVFHNKLPRDYLAFAKIHNGFCKASDMGMIRLEQLKKKTRSLHQIALESHRMITSGGKNVDPTCLIPFYEHFEKESFQCFNEDWYPSSEMGNVYFSGVDFTTSEIANRGGWKENLAFPTFLDWLTYYLTNEM